ncbi:FAD/NAD(P)-binding domain-containing protein [Paxillus ammoniavirescens]|nr:FAD/NAD(P)-binding domain-containing protein [Paxillus ammoniavirescens]
MSTKRNIVIVGAGFAGTSIAASLSAKLDAAKYNLILINSRPYAIPLPASARLVVSSSSKLEDSVFVPLDKLFKNGNGQNKVGIVKTIEEKKNGKGGTVVLESGERVPFEILVIASGSKWQGPLDLPEHESDVLPHVNAWREKFAKATHVVLAGGGAVGIELAGELKDEYPKTRVTIVQGGKQLLNATHPDSFRAGLEQRLRARGVEILFNEYIDDIPEMGNLGVTTRSGTQIPTADLVVSTRGPSPNTAFVASLGSSALSGSGYIKVKPTLQLLNNPYIFAAGDVIDWAEQKQAAKTKGHAAVVAANVLTLLEDKGASSVYGGSPELIVITNGRNGGMAYFSFLWGFTLGDWFTRLVKSRGLMVGMFRSGLGY